MNPFTFKSALVSINKRSNAALHTMDVSPLRLAACKMDYALAVATSDVPLHRLNEYLATL